LRAEAAARKKRFLPNAFQAVVAGKAYFPPVDRAVHLPEAAEQRLGEMATVDGVAAAEDVKRDQAFCPDGMNRLPVGYNGCT